MPGYFAVLTMILLIVTVVVRVALMKRAGIEAMKFGQMDKTDFLIPPFALFYLYTIFAAAFHWPLVSRQTFFQADPVSWVGVVFCVTGLLLFWYSLFSFGQSFRVGIDAKGPDTLITTGAFAISRNPIYVAFALVLIGQFLIFSNWIVLLYLAAAMWLFNRQVLREEEFMQQHYGQAYLNYRQKVRRYL